MLNFTYARSHELADRFGRWLAKAIDSVLLGVAILPAFLSDPTDAVEQSPNLFVLAAGLLLIFGVQGYLLVNSGQSIGKKVMRMRIVQADTGDYPTWYQVLLLRELLSLVLIMIPLIGTIYNTIDTLFVFRGDRRCIHDLIAGTKVVNAYREFI